MKLGYFLLSCLLAFIGGHMLNYTIIFLALEWFDSSFVGGIGFALCFGPPIILGWIAGVYCDRYSPRHVILVAQNAYLVAAAILLLVLIYDSEIKFIWYLIASFHLGVAWSFVAPARFASVRFYATNENLATATILLNVMVMLGFGLAPILVKTIAHCFGWQGAIYVSITALLLSSLVLYLLPFEFSGQNTNNVKTMFSEVMTLINKTAELKTYLALAACVYLLMGPIQILLPRLVSEVLNLTDVQQGVYLSLVALALIIGGVCALKLKRFTTNIEYLILFILAGAIGFGVLSVVDNLPTSSILLFIAASFGGIAVSLVVSGLQQFSPERAKGRVMATYTILSQVMPAVSGLIAGYIGQYYGLTMGFWFFTTLVALLLLLVLFFGSIKKVEAP